MGLYALLGRGFNNPVDVAFGAGDVMYVVNRVGPEVAVRMPYKRISICTRDQDYLGEFSTGGTGAGEIMWPASIAVGPDGNVYVSDEALNRISIFDPKGGFLSMWGVRGAEKGQLNRPAGIAFDSEGNLLVADGLNHRIQRFTSDGLFLDTWGGQGSGDGELNIPWGISLDSDGNVHVADWRNDRIQSFDPQGRHLATIGTSGDGDGQLKRPSGVVVDQSGNILVADWGNERVQVFDSDGQFITKRRGESGLSKWAEDYFKANTDEFESRQKADLEPEPNGQPSEYVREQSAAVEKLFWGPTSVRLDDEGAMYVVESCRHRIQVFKPEQF
jgi:DNA-binding beta-propeller fold protein YncE